MNLKSDTEKALETWLLTSTWDSGHPLDWDRFYKFVDQYQKDHGFSIDEPALRDIMKSADKRTAYDRIKPRLFRLLFEYGILEIK